MFLYLVNADLRCLLHIAVIIFFLAVSALLSSASVDAHVCIGRCARLRRSVRMSASVDADDVCILKKVA